MTPEGFNARSRVHEYGGAATLISGDLDRRLRLRDGPPQPRRRAGAARAAHARRRRGATRTRSTTSAHNRLIAVREDHEDATVASHGEWSNDLVAIDLATGAVSVLAEGSDFYAAPRLSPDGSTLVWLEWHHPNMPWDGTELHLAAVAADGALGQSRIVAGSRSDWISQPRWSPDGMLYFAAEPEGWMNLFRLVDGRIEAVTSDRGRVRRAGLAVRLRHVRLHGGWQHPRDRPIGRPRPAREGRPRRRHRADRPAVHRDGGPVDRWRSGRAPGRRTGPAGVRDRARPRRQPHRAPPGHAQRPGARGRLDRRAHRVPDDRRQDRIRQLLPAHQSLVRGARRASSRRSS